MLHKKALQNDQLITNLNGTLRAEGNTGGGTSGDSTWTDAGATYEADEVTAGDVIYIDGEGEFVVDSVTDETNLELDGVLSATLTNTSWRVTHSRLCAWSEVVHLGREDSRWTVIYESDDFTVS